MNITTKEELLDYMMREHGSDNPLPRVDLNSVQIKFANQLVKEGLIIKGKCPVGNSLTNGTVQFYMPKPTWCYFVDGKFYSE